eukprot:PITA_33224
MHQFHSIICGGHPYWKTTAHKILRARYFWLALFSEVFSFVKSCDMCYRFEGKEHLRSLPLRPIHASGLFQQWGLDFIGENNPHSIGQHKWILVATDYFTKWIEAIPTRKADHHVVMRVTTKKPIGNSPFKLVYGTESVLPIWLILPMENFLQEEHNEEEDNANRICDLAEVHQIRDQLVEKSAANQNRIRKAFDMKAKTNRF